MSRAEFTKQTKQAAMRRAGGYCEGIVEGRRCNVPLSHGVEFDHADADWFSKDNSLENCSCLCRTCHKAKTRDDVKKIAKSKRIRDREMGIRKSVARPMPGSRASGLKRKLNGTTERRP